MLGWTADYLLQPDGPNAGQPWEFTPEQVRIVLRFYEVDERGRFVHRRGVVRRMKGWGKDPFLAAIAACELAGPCRFDGFDAHGLPVAKPHPAAWIQVAAVSRDQTRNTMTLFPGMFSPAAVDDFGLDIGKEVIYSRGRGRLEAVTSSPRALEGGRPSLVIANETHHWIATNDGLEMAQAIRRNLAKSRDGSARVVEITNAHLPGENSAAEATYNAWKKAGGKLPGVYYDSVEAPLRMRRGQDGGEVVIPLDELDDDTLRADLLGCRGDSVWCDVDRLLEEIRDPVPVEDTGEVLTESLARRFYLNQVTAAGATWLPEGKWEELARPDRVIEDGSTVVLGFDGSKTHDTTVLTVVSVEETPHVDLVEAWERPTGAAGVDWKVPRSEVREAVRDACRRWNVLEIAWDEWLWLDAAEELEDEGLPVVIFPQGMTHMGPATQRFYEAVVSGTLTHADNPVLNAHVRHAQVKRDSRGARLTKDGKNSPRKIDAAVAAVMAFDRAASQDLETELHIW